VAAFLVMQNNVQPSKNSNQSNSNGQNQPIEKKYLELKELGIKFQINDLPDLKYAFKKSNKGESTAVLYTDALAKYCDPKATAAPLGTVLKINGQYSAETQSGYGALLKQFDGYFVSYQISQQLCTQDSAGIKILNDQQSLLNKILLSPEEI